MGEAGSEARYIDRILERVYKLYDWFDSRLRRTILLGITLRFPRKFQDPLPYLGILTFTAFLITGLTGGLLMFYYTPTFEEAYESVGRINDELPFGFVLRNLHYQASNAMILLALMHLFYLYFRGRYKLRNEILWITGIVMGVLAILEAYTGYDLIMNERAMLAINIGRALVFSTPGVGGTLGQMIFSGGFTDWLIRYNALHVFILPMIILTILVIHFPRVLVVDIPTLSTFAGILFVVGGLFPVELGEPYVLLRPPKVTIPEWYLTGIYASLRTGLDAFLMGALVPALLIALFMAVPFIDIGRKIRMRERPFFTALGLTIITQFIVVTAWGFFAPGQFIETPLLIDVVTFFAVLGVLAIASYTMTYLFFRWKRQTHKESTSKNLEGDKASYLSPGWISILIFALVGLQIFLNFSAFLANLEGYRELSMIYIGFIIISFGATFHLLRYRINLPSQEKSV